MTSYSTEASVSSLLHDRGAPIWEATHQHPMIGEIGRGSLPYNTFRFYFEQNIMYLEEFARSLDFMVARAPDVDAAVVLRRFRTQIVNHELPANREFLTRLGGSPLHDALRDMTSVNYGYTRHLLYATSNCSPAHGLAAMLPCQWSYGEIATRLAKDAPSDAIYSDWISMFANPAYDVLVQDSLNLLDRMASSEKLSVNELAPMFDWSSRYELAFWQMVYTRGRDGAVGSPTRFDTAKENYN